MYVGHKYTFYMTTSFIPPQPHVGAPQTRQKILSQSWSTKLSKMSLYAVVLTLIFTGRGLAQTTWKIAKGHFPCLTQLTVGTMHSSRYQFPVVYQTQILPSDTAKYWSGIHHLRECISTAPESSSCVHYITPVSACCWCSQACAHGNSFHEAPHTQKCADVASRFSLELCS